MINHDSHASDVEVDEGPTYDEVAVDSITAFAVGAFRFGIGALALTGLQVLWPDPPAAVTAIEVTLTHIGVIAAIGGILNGIVELFLGIDRVRTWRRLRARAAGGDDQ